VHPAWPNPPVVDSTSPSSCRLPGTPAELAARSPSPDGWRPPVVRRALELFCDHILERRILQQEIGLQPLEPVVFILQFLQPIHVRGLQATVLGFPLIVGSGADPVVPPDFVDGATGVGLLQDRHDLDLGELRLPQGNLLSRGC